MTVDAPDRRACTFRSWACRATGLLTLLAEPGVTWLGDTSSPAAGDRSRRRGENSATIVRAWRQG